MPHTLTDAEAQEFIDLGVKARELPRLAFPDATDDFCEWFLWEKTPFPMGRGVHDIVDAVADAFVRGPRCDDITAAGYCGNRVTDWGGMCHLHRPAFVVRRAGGGA